MAVGQIVLIQSGQSNQVVIPSGNYPWPTIRVLNPNDGVAYIKQNGPCRDSGYGDWDYKVPSQSYGLLPGAGEGWQSVGIYYLDQSGANRPGEISVYLTMQNSSEPIFQAIGRAIVSQSSSVDISSGAQPANPGAGYGRLWIDTGGHLNVLQPNGSNYIEYDSSNIGTATLGGDLYGTIATAAINIRNTYSLDMMDASGGAHAFLFADTANNTFIRPIGNALYIQNTTGSTNVGSIDSAGNFYANGGGTFGSNVSGVNGIFSANVNAEGGWYYMNPASNVYMQWNGSVILFSHSIATNGTAFSFQNNGSISLEWNGSYIVSTQPFWGNSSIIAQGALETQNGTLYFNAAATVYWQWNGNYIYTPQPVNIAGAMVCNGNVWAQGGVVYFNPSGSMYWAASGTTLYTNASVLQVNLAATIGTTLTVTGGTTLNGWLTLASGTSPAQAGGGFIYWHQNQSVYEYCNYPNLILQGLNYASGQFDIIGQSCYTSVGRSSNELGAYTHFYGAGSGYIVLDFSATSVTQRSSLKYKTGIVPVESAECLRRVLDTSMSVYKYQHVLDEKAQAADAERPPNSSKPNPSRIGFAAEEMHNVVPECVAYSTDDGSPDGINYSELTSLLWGAIRELNRKVDSLAGTPA